MPLPLCVAFVFVSFSSFASSLNSDGLALLALKAAIESDPSRSLSSWSESDATPCHWVGIGCNSGRVTSLSLPNKALTGYIPSELGLLDWLTRLTLSHNNFSKPIPSHLFNATKLFFLDLSHNLLSGEVPQEIKVLKNLSHLDLSSNSLNGLLPVSLPELSSLSGTLNLSYNRFSGEIPAAFGRFPVLVSLDLSHNNLTGKVPQVGSLLNQGPTAFSGNPGLCGFPLGISCIEAENPKPTLTESPENQENPNLGSYDGDEERGKDKNGSMTVPLISGVSVVIGAVSVSVWLLRRQWRSEDAEKGKWKEEKEFEEEAQKGKFVVVDEGFLNVELEDLLRASAYVVGKGRNGILYKVVVGRGSAAAAVGATVVAVRRLCEGDSTWRFKEFEAEAEAIGKVNHPNIVRLRAYYYANDEKLLITDFIRNGSLYTALHGNLVFSFVQFRYFLDIW